VADEARQVLKNINAVLTEAGYSFADVVKTTIFLQDMNDFAVVNQVYGEYFTESAGQGDRCSGGAAQKCQGGNLCSGLEKINPRSPQIFLGSVLRCRPLGLYVDSAPEHQGVAGGRYSILPDFRLGYTDMVIHLPFPQEAVEG